MKTHPESGFIRILDWLDTAAMPSAVALLGCLVMLALGSS